ncbi:hypothetical protein WAI453_007403 [Rhynchosporium graminicola]
MTTRPFPFPFRFRFRFPSSNLLLQNSRKAHNSQHLNDTEPNRTEPLEIQHNPKSIASQHIYSRPGNSLSILSNSAPQTSVFGISIIKLNSLSVMMISQPGPFHQTSSVCRVVV